MSPEEESRWQRRLDRQRQRVEILERDLEDKTRALFLLNQQLRQANEYLEQQVAERTEALQGALAQAQASSAAKTTFLAQMSHELRTPLHGLIGTIDLLERTPLDERQQQLAQIAQRSSSHLLRVINDVLDFTRLESGHLELEQAPFRLSTLLEEVVDMFAASAAQKGLPLILQLPADDPTLLGDAHRLRQVLANLLGNALKFTDQGRVTVRARLAPCPDTPDTLRLTLEVIDTGAGIPAERLEHIFAPFAQAEAATTRRFGGTGLGLSICRRLLDTMGGELSVTSVLGSGSTFTSTTCHPQVTAAAAALQNLEADLDAVTCRVLLVDDNRVNLTLGELMLSSLGCQVTQARSGEDALVAVAQADPPPDLILMDCHMPGMSGPEAARTLRQRGYTGNIVALTADISPENRDEILASGMQDILGKPYLRKDLIPFLRLHTTPTAQPMLLDRVQALALMQGRADRVARLQAVFLEQLPESLGKLQAAAAIGDVVAVRQQAHALKGASGAICALHLQERAAALERRPEAHPDLLPPLLQIAAETRALLDGMAATG